MKKYLTYLHCLNQKVGLVVSWLHQVVDKLCLDQPLVVASVIVGDLLVNGGCVEWWFREGLFCTP